MNGLTRGVRSTVRRFIDRITLRGDLQAALNEAREELALLRHYHTGTVKGLFALQQTIPGQVAGLQEQLSVVRDRQFVLHGEHTAARNDPAATRGDQAWLAAELAAVQAEFARLAADHDALKRQVLFSRRIDVLNTGSAKLLIYTDDFGYQFTPEHWRHYQLTARDYEPPARVLRPPATQTP